ncbi:(2E,6E)-farnesyl diphosphate synthase [Alteromonas sp. a30]|nr:(2E,6E)-farnesyl diphosphate synthase [Alteromonas sp. a30]
MSHLLEQVINLQPQQDSALLPAMQYSLLNGGKRIRPFLIYATGEMLDINKENLDMCAIALECVHSYSLIHDDLPAMDDDNLRRGKPTCHIVYGEATAILAGDALQTLAFNVLADYPAPATVERIHLVSILSKAAGNQGMCGGQSLDLQATNQQVSLDALHQIHELKTGALISASMEMACVFADLPEQHRNTFQQYARALGLAFQVKDDILDITANTETLGKPQGSDEEANKSTFPSLLGLEGAENYLNELHMQALNALNAIPYNTELLKAFSDFVVQREH